MVELTFAKGDKTRTVVTPAAAIRLRNDGWKEVTTPPRPSPVAEEGQGLTEAEDRGDTPEASQPKEAKNAEGKQTSGD